MSINKKSLISNRKASKKAILTKPEVTGAEPTKILSNSTRILSNHTRILGTGTKVAGLKPRVMGN